ncbi:MAG: acyl-CoA dehydrogenase family protein [Smithellaceae bacterium]
MDLGLNRQQEMLKNMVHEFALRELLPNANGWDDKGEFPAKAVLSKMGELKLLGMGVNKEFGGNSLGHMARMIVTEEIAWAYPPAAMCFTGVDESAWILQTYAAEEVKQKFIPAMCKGEKTVCFAATEPTGGSDMSGMQTTAEDTTDGYVINGRKVFISFAEGADFCILNARHNGKIDVFIMEKGTPGFEITRREKMWGLRGDPINELVFSNCRIPKNYLLGNSGSGAGILIAAISMVARPAAGAIAVGIARCALEAAVKFAKERKLGGKAVGDFQAIQTMLADMDTEIDAARWLTYQCAWLLDQGKSSREVAKESARAKLYGTDMANNVCRKAVQIMGGYGVSLDYPAIRRLNDAVALIPANGTMEVSRIIIAREILK